MLQPVSRRTTMTITVRPSVRPSIRPTDRSRKNIEKRKTLPSVRERLLIPKTQKVALGRLPCLGRLGRLCFHLATLDCCTMVFCGRCQRAERQMLQPGVVDRERRPTSKTGLRQPKRCDVAVIVSGCALGSGHTRDRERPDSNATIRQSARHCGQCVGVDWCGPDQSVAAVLTRRKIPPPVPSPSLYLAYYNCTLAIPPPPPHLFARLAKSAFSIANGSVLPTHCRYIFTCGCIFR